KKSNQRLTENIHVSVQLPPKPSAPKVAMTEEKAVFQTVKAAKIPLPVPLESTPTSQIARIESLKAKPSTIKPLAKVETSPVEKLIQKSDAKITSTEKPHQVSPVNTSSEKQTPPTLIKA